MRRRKTAANNLEQPEVVDGGFLIDALVLPYGGHKMGKDCAGEYFDQRTDFKTANLRYPPVVYAHGMPIDKMGEADRTVVGETLERWYDDQGGWAKLKIFNDTPFTEEIKTAYVKRTLKFSSYGLLKRAAADGHIETWLPGEFTVATHETPVSVCNLLSKAQPYGKLAFEEIYNGQDDKTREQLRKLLENDGEIVEPLDEENLIATNNNNPAGADADADKLKAFAEAEDEDMKPEELKAAIDGALAPMMTRIEALEKPAPPEKKPEDDKQKTDGTDLFAFVKQKTETLQVDAATNTAATQLVDGYVNAGRVAPEKRLQMIKAVSGAILQDGRQKVDGGALDMVIEMIEGGAVVAPNGNAGKLKMFGYQPADPKSADDKDVDRMSKAALAD
jgi:hypothetical protein